MKALAMAALAALACGCASHEKSVGPYATQGAQQRRTVEAEALNREAADLLQRDPTRAEALLREALTKDLFFGPAHNNLGVLHLGRGELYEAAAEFEWARKLLPGHADPRINLAITLERAGRAGEALAAYKTALEVQPGSVVAMQGAAVIAVRDGRAEPELATWLEQIALAGESEPWRDWARRASATRGAAER